MRQAAAAVVAATTIMLFPQPCEAAEPAWQREAIRFGHDGLALAGDLLLPAGTGLPAVMLIQGSGASGRSNRWAYSIAESLAAQGIAVLIPDKRGVGESAGDWRTAGFEELAADAQAGWGLLAAHPAIDPRRVGYLGLSQGGHIAPLAAAGTPGAAFAVNLVGSLQVMEQQLYDELDSAYREHGLDDRTIDWLQELARFSFDYLKTGSGWERYLARHREISAGPLAGAAETWPTTPDDPYWTLWRKIHDYDPVPHWRSIAAAGIPALIVYGADDSNVRVEASVARFRQLLSGSGIELHVYEGTGHALRDAGTQQLRADIFGALADWIHAASGNQRPD